MWTKIHDSFFVAKVPNGKCFERFTATVQAVGIGSAGKAIVLKGMLLGTETVIAEFWTKGDGYNSDEERSVQGKLWMKQDALSQGQAMIELLIKSFY